MRLLIIGASGFVGQELYRLALEKGIETKGTSASGRNGFLPFRLNCDSLEDLLEASNYQEDEEICAVLAGAITNIQQCFQNPDLSRAVNVIGMIRLIQGLFHKRIKMLFLSSDMVFDGQKGAYTETDKTNPLCTYGQQKKEVEDYLLKYCPDALIYRLAKQVSIDQRKGNLFTELYNQYRNGNTIRCIDGLCFNPTDVRDTAECILQGLDTHLCGLYHVAPSTAYTRYRLAQEFFRFIDVSPKMEICTEAQFHFPEPKALNTSLICKKFQDSISHTFRPMRTTINEFLTEHLIKEE